MDFQCELDLASSRAQLDRIAALRANVANGDVTVGDIAGRATITGTAVVTRIGHVAADVELTADELGRIDAELPEPSGERYNEAGMAGVNL